MAERILDGANPATMPVEVQRDFALYVNSTAAEGFGIQIPAAVKARAAAKP